MGEPVLCSRSSPPTPIIRKINHGLQLLEEGSGPVERTGSVQCCSPSVGVSLVQSQLGFVTRPDHQTGDESRPTPSEIYTAGIRCCWPAATSQVQPLSLLPLVHGQDTGGRWSVLAGYYNGSSQDISLLLIKI